MGSIDGGSPFILIWLDGKLQKMQLSMSLLLIQLMMGCRDGNGLDLILDPRDPNSIESDLGRFKMNLNRIYILMCGSKTDLEQV